MANSRNTDTRQSTELEFTFNTVVEPIVKVILLGNTNVGKTSLVTRYVKNAYLPALQETIGAAFCQKKVKVRGEFVKLYIWDTAGHERYRSLVRLYYRDAKAALICFDLTNRTSWDDVTHWVQDLLDKEESCKIYLVGTKSDLITGIGARLREVNEEEIGRFIDSQKQAVIVQYYETSSLTGQGIDKLFADVAITCYDETQPTEIEKSTVGLRQSTHPKQKGGCSC